MCKKRYVVYVLDVYSKSAYDIRSRGDSVRNTNMILITVSIRVDHLKEEPGLLLPNIERHVVISFYISIEVEMYSIRRNEMEGVEYFSH